MNHLLAMVVVAEEAVRFVAAVRGAPLSVLVSLRAVMRVLLRASQQVSLSAFPLRERALATQESLHPLIPP